MYIEKINKDITIESIHREFIPKYDRWNGRVLPRIGAWFMHIGEFLLLWFKWKKPYYKHGRTLGTCRQHSKTEFEDWLWLTAEIFWMITKIELPIVSEQSFLRVWTKMNQTRASLNNR